MPVIKGWKFPVQVDSNTGKIMTVEDNENIKQSIRIILNTQKHERKIVPNFGTNSRDFIFEIVDPEFISNVRREMESSINTWESHIRDLNVSVNATTGTISTVEVNIDYITTIMPIQERVTNKLEMNG